MNIVDLVIIAIVALGAFRGFKNGLLIETASIIGFLLGIYCAINYTKLALTFIPDWNISANTLETSGFIIIFLSVLAITYGIGKLAERFISVVMLGKLNQILGLLFGVAKTVLILSAIIVLLNVFDETPNFIPQQAKEESTLFKPLSGIAPAIFPIMENTITEISQHQDPSTIN